MLSQTNLKLDFHPLSLSPHSKIKISNFVNLVWNWNIHINKWLHMFYRIPKLSQIDSKVTENDYLLLASKAEGVSDDVFH